MNTYYADKRTTVYHGDCLDVLASMPDNSVDSIVTDPPYGLSNTKPVQVADVLKAWVTGDTEAVPAKRGGFMGKDWDSFVPPPAVWEECLRVLKPGGHMAVFAGARTQDLMGLSIRLAGFEIRDSLAWIYGSGFPKSHDVSKAIDKAGGLRPKVQAETLRAARSRAGLTREEVAAAIDCTASSVRDWEEGRARATGRPIEYITPSPQYRSRLADLLGYTDDERKITGPAIDRRHDGTVIGLGHSGVTYGDSSTDAARQWEGWGTALKPAFEPIVLARKPLEGTVANNVLEHGTGAINVDACRVGTTDNLGRPQGTMPQPMDWGNRSTDGPFVTEGHAAGRWPANVLLDEHAAAWVDEQSGVSKSSIGKPRGAASGDGWGMTATGAEYDDQGGASRFFPVFKYQAKAPKTERPNVDGIQHPTVKPLKLMQWLLRLITPPGGTVLDPFAGSGTTIEAAILEGFTPIGIEKEADYLPLITTRITRAKTSVQEVLDLGGIA